MSRSLTVPVPSPRRLLQIVMTIAVALVVLLVGVRVGASVLGPSPLMSVVDGGDLHQVQVLGGAVYLGHIVSDDGGILRLSGAALLRQQDAPAPSTGQAGTQLIVQSLTTDPFGIGSDVVIPLTQVTLVGVVAPASSLAQAYGQAMGTSPAPSPSPVPSP